MEANIFPILHGKYQYMGLDVKFSMKVVILFL